MDLVRQSFGITLVFVLLWLALWWLKRRGIARIGLRMKPANVKPDMESLERLVLTPQHSIHLVRVKNQILVVGLHPSGMSLLNGHDRADESKGSVMK
jgi:flagellar biogenesis protein FliO